MDLSFARALAATRARVRRLASDESYAGQALLQIDTLELMEHTRPRGSELREAVRLLDGYGRLKAMYATIQAAISAAIAGDEVVIAPGVYAEDLYVNARLTLTCAAERSGPERTGKAIVVGHVVVAATAVELVVDGVAIDGGLTMQSAGGATASITLRSSGIQGSGVSCARLSWLPHVRD